MKALLKIAAFGAGAAAAIAAGAVKCKKELKTDSGKRKAYDLGNKAIYNLCRGIACVLPEGYRPYAYEFDNKGFMPGMTEYQAQGAEQKKWSLGFAKVSLLPDSLEAASYYVGGYLHYPPNRATAVLDDQMFRCICIDDASSNGKIVLGVIDCVGISNKDIRDIRLLTEDFAKQHNIVSIHISATHSHSEIDTQGLWGDLVGALKSNPLKVLQGENDYLSGRNEDHMAMLRQRCSEAIKEACLNMKEGSLSYSVMDGSKFVRDKRPPEVIFSDIVNLYFEPDDKSKPTRAVFMAAHPTQFGDDNTVISADYPYYVCSKLEENNENALFFQGAELAIATQRDGNIPEGLDRTNQIIEYGKAVGEFCIKSFDENKRSLTPSINSKSKEIYLNASNYLFLTIGKLRLVNNNLVKVGSKRTDMKFVTELGIVKLGEELTLALIPGELSPEIVLGGCLDKNNSYNSTSWDFPALKDLFSGYLCCVGLCNDAIGYIIPDNDFGSVFAPLHYEEAVSTGINAASSIVKEFIDLASEF